MRLWVNTLVSGTENSGDGGAMWHQKHAYCEVGLKEMSVSGAVAWHGRNKTSAGTAELFITSVSADNTHTLCQWSYFFLFLTAYVAVKRN